MGPLDAQQVRKLVEVGTLSRSDLIRSDGKKKWRRAGTVDGLFKAQPSLRQLLVAVIGPGCVLVVGVVLVLFFLYQVLFGGVIWSVRTETVAGYRITKATVFGQIVAYASLALGLMMAWRAWLTIAGRLPSRRY